MFLRAALAFLVLPGLVAFAGPAFIARDDIAARLPRSLGVAVFALGTGLLLWCVRDFYRAGRGTLAPWDPPQHLVSVGLYRVTRNPMYVAVTLILLGWTLAYQSRELAVYLLIVAVAFHLRVVLYEEPWLARTYGDAWNEYARRVPRWLIGKRRPR
jgi:protein-S-isoprenylcysteine O-methyltransferase Ste14